ncbi:hypothetical protein EWM64_g5437 [Hericium alpestre]|uniref:Mtf2-like C-terminal domain-containing protein n=1 Tax=Hericium alpestre TaxID=135208 RepID=A0A4Y9ZXE2_9AGAM|nr:hypothetical protein EWM64_g5437 [Hericium alpestre]
MATPGDILPLDKAGIISTVLEDILYGFSVFMYGGTLWILFNRRTTKKVSRAMVVVATLLFIFPTMVCLTPAWILAIADLRTAYRRGHPPYHRRACGQPRFRAGRPGHVVCNPAQFTFVFKNAIYAFQTVTGDGVVSIWVIIFPLIMLCSVITTITGAVWACSQADPAQGDIFAAQTGRWITAFYASTLSTHSFVFGCTTPAYNELIETRWACFRDLRGVCEALEEMKANAIQPDGQTRKLVDNLRREFGQRNLWIEESDEDTGEVWNMMSTIERLVARPATDDRRAGWEHTGPQRRSSKTGSRKPSRAPLNAWKDSQNGSNDDKMDYGLWPSRGLVY